jgi:hypothetical protein
MTGLGQARNQSHERQCIKRNKCLNEREEMWRTDFGIRGFVTAIGEGRPRSVQTSLLRAIGFGSSAAVSGPGRPLLEEGPEDLPPINAKAVTPKAIPADVHQPHEAALPAARNRKCACKRLAAELVVVLLAGDLPPTLPVH